MQKDKCSISLLMLILFQVCIVFSPHIHTHLHHICTCTCSWCSSAYPPMVGYSYSCEMFDAFIEYLFAG